MTFLLGSQPFSDLPNCLTRIPHVLCPSGEEPTWGYLDIIMNPCPTALAEAFFQTPARLGVSHMSNECFMHSPHKWNIQTGSMSVSLLRMDLVALGVDQHPRSRVALLHTLLSYQLTARHECDVLREAV